MNDMTIFKAKVYDTTEVFALKKLYDKDRKRKPVGKNRLWQYMDEVELQKSKRLLGAAVERLRAGEAPPPPITQVTGRGLKV